MQEHDFSLFFHNFKSFIKKYSDIIFETERSEYPELMLSSKRTVQ